MAAKPKQTPDEPKAVAPEVPEVKSDEPVTLTSAWGTKITVAAEIAHHFK